MQMRCTVPSMTRGVTSAEKVPSLSPYATHERSTSSCFLLNLVETHVSAGKTKYLESRRRRKRFLLLGESFSPRSVIRSGVTRALHSRSFAEKVGSLACATKLATSSRWSVVRMFSLCCSSAASALFVGPSAASPFTSSFDKISSACSADRFAAILSEMRKIQFTTLLDPVPRQKPRARRALLSS